MAFAALVIALALFQPWKLVVDDKVDQAAPLGARPLVTDEQSTEPSNSVNDVPGTAGQPEAPSTEPVTPVTPVAPVAATEFIGIDHGTEGRLLLLQDSDGKRFVRFEGFETSNGPDLFVYLSTNPVGADEGAFDDEFVSLGRLQGNIGDQNYEVPSDVDLADYASVVVWCDRFNSAFGAAPLRA